MKSNAKSGTRSPRKRNRLPSSQLWRDVKRDQTRAALLESTIQCFIEVGYAQTTTPLIAERAGISRGAMTHHFSSRDEIITEAAHYLMKRRLEELTALVDSVPNHTTPDPKASDFLNGIRAISRFFQLPSYIAFHEMTVAARTNPGLSKIIDPVEQQMEAGISQVIDKTFTGWKGLEGTRDLDVDVVFLMMQGLALTHIKRQPEERSEAVVQFLADQLYEAYLRARDIGRENLSGAKKKISARRPHI